MKPTINQSFNDNYLDKGLNKFFYLNLSAKMKQFLIAMLFVFASFSSFTQLKNEDKISAVYGIEWLTQMKVDNPELLDLLDLYVEHGFKIEHTSAGKYTELTPLTSIALTSKEGGEISIEQFMEESTQEDFNPLKYRFFPTLDVQVYKLDGYDAIIYILPQSTILSK